MISEVVTLVKRVIRNIGSIDRRPHRSLHIIKAVKDEMDFVNKQKGNVCLKLI